MLTSKEIRQQFIDFFKQRAHTEVKSASLVPMNDPTLLFTNAGMNQFKDVFLGLGTRNYKRAVNSQKCLRVSGKHNDLEQVGRDGYHHTFFEMLGNWSFGDYYKKEAILWAWQLLTEVWKFPKDKLYATVYNADKDTYKIWKDETDIDDTHILYFGRKDNFWEMGETGPCGPCSEIHIDLGVEHCSKKNQKNHQCQVNGNCGRFIELWNLVFIQFYRDEKGELHKLKDRFVDTGAGFERIVSLLQNRDSNNYLATKFQAKAQKFVSHLADNYTSDLFLPIIEQISDMSNKDYSFNNGVSHRVISDHIRALAFSIADGVMPSNEGRGYVIRRILRRADWYGRLIGLTNPFLYKLVDTLIQIMGDQYYELKEMKKHIELVIKSEEERFNITLDRGLRKFQDLTVGLHSGDIISGKNVFALYDTYGFPVDLTRIMADRQGLEIDEQGFQKEMALQRERCRKSAKFQICSDDFLAGKDIEWTVYFPCEKTEFVGYEQVKADTYIAKYSIDNQDNVRIVLCQTPFYAESGGQVSDTGKIYNQECSIEIQDVQKQGDLYIHFGKLKKGEINSEKMIAEIDESRRKNIARNHTATHLLHSALRKVLGEHVHQKGSLVKPDGFRFDFTHFQQMSKQEIALTEEIVNQKIRENLPISVHIEELDKARKDGAIALFNEKYADKVRVVTIKDFSNELCGGTHLNATGEIGIFLILSEESVAFNVRRIEAITGEQAYKIVQNIREILQEFQYRMRTPQDKLIEKIDKLLLANKRMHQQLERMKLNSATNTLDKLFNQARVINGVKIISGEVKVSSNNELRKIADALRNKLDSGIGLLGAKINDKVSLICLVTDDLVDKYNAGKLVREVAKIVQGSGGGKASLAMAGGKDISKLSTALEHIHSCIKYK